MSTERRETLDKAVGRPQLPGIEPDDETGRVRLTEELFEELHAAEDSPERIVELLNLSPAAIRSAVSGQDFSESEKQSLRELLEAAEALARRGSEPSLSDKFDELMISALHRLGVPTHDDIYTLTQKVEELNSKIEKLRHAETVQEAEPTARVITPNTVVRADG